MTEECEYGSTLWGKNDGEEVLGPRVDFYNCMNKCILGVV